MPPVVIAGAIAGAASIGGGLLAASSQRHAADQAADTAANNTAANNALTREIYGQNRDILAPDVNRGNLAGSALTDLLLGTNSYGSALSAFNGGTGGSGMVGTGGGSSALTARQQWAQGAIDAMAPNITRSSTWNTANQISDPYQRLQYLLSQSPANSDQRPLYNAYVANHADPGPTTPATGTTTPTTPATGTGAATGTGSSALSAFDRFRQGTNYQWRFNQGNDALQNQWAARGTFDSGAEKKALLEYGQNFASNELSNYMDLLARQQATGLSAAQAIAGVSSNYAGTIAASNTSAANAAANAALARGNANSALYGSIASGIGNIAGVAAGGFGNSAAIPSYASVNSGYTMPVNAGYSGVAPSLPGGLW